MTPHAIIVHGTGGSPDVCWYRWLRDRLAARGYRVDLPSYPELNVEPVETFLPRVLAEHPVEAGTVLVGHSGGAALLLAVLEHIEVRVSQAILVAGYSTPPNDSAEPVLQESYDWAAIRAHVDDLVVISSVTDPYGCDAAQGRRIVERAGGRAIVLDDGHFGDVDQPYPTFPLLDELIA